MKQTLHPTHTASTLLLSIALILISSFISVANNQTDSLSIADSLLLRSKQLLHQKDLQHAERSIKEARYIFEKYGSREMQACAQLAHAELQMEKHKFDEALLLLLQCKPILKKKNKVRWAQSVMLNGYIYLQKHEPLKASVYLERAFAINTELRNNENLAVNSLYLAELHFSTNNFEHTKLYAEQTMRLAEGQQQLLVRSNASKLLFQLYQAEENYEQAFEMLLLHKTYNDSIFSAETLREQARVELQHQYEKKRKADQLVQQETAFKRERQLQQQKYVSLFAILGSVIFLLLAGLVYRNLRNSTRSNKKLKKHNDTISEQKEKIEQQSQHLLEVNEVVERKTKKITDSIEYAKRIQDAMLPIPRRLKRYFPEMFVIQKPKDILSGDFYWVGDRHESVVIAVADCTGHGVPGALMSMLGTSLLNEILRVGIWNADEILEELRLQVKESLHQRGILHEAKDGMDIALCAIDLVDMTLQFSGANNPMYLCRNKELIVFKPVRNPIGIYVKERAFENEEIDLQKGDVIYLFSDGFPDQFNARGYKFLHKRFKELLVEVSHLPMPEQETILKQKLNAWQGKADQTDDIIVLGFRVS